jgi:hypothetical protein
LREASTKLRDDSDLFYYLGMAHYQFRQSAETNAALRHAFRLNISGKLADEAKRALADCCQEPQ